MDFLWHVSVQNIFLVDFPSQRIPHEHLVQTANRKRDLNADCLLRESFWVCESTSLDLQSHQWHIVQKSDSDMQATCDHWPLKMWSLLASISLLSLAAVFHCILTSFSAILLLCHNVSVDCSALFFRLSCFQLFCQWASFSNHSKVMEMQQCSHVTLCPPTGSECVV